MIYDEAMEVNVNGYSFLAFHKFELLGRFGVSDLASHLDHVQGFIFTAGRKRLMQQSLGGSEALPERRSAAERLSLRRDWVED